MKTMKFSQAIGSALGAVVMESGIQFSLARVCTRTTIPYSRALKDEVLPGVEWIVDQTRRLAD